jgi:hypothetical protein
LVLKAGAGYSCGWTLSISLTIPTSVGPTLATRLQGFGSVPNEALLAQADINTWNAFAPGRAATLTQVNDLLTNARLASGAIPLNFFRVPIPAGFSTTNPNAFDITTLSGLKLYRLRQSLDTNFGTLAASTPYQPRYIQWGLKLYF